MKIWELDLLILTPSGGAMRHPLAVFETKEDAELACSEERARIAATMADAKVIVPSPQGIPRILDTLSNVLAAMGIHGFSAVVRERETRGAVVLAPTPRVTLQ